MPATSQQPAGTGIVLPTTPVVVLLDGPAGARRACQVEAPARLLRLWCLLNAADHELHQMKLPPQAAPRLQHLLESVRADLERSVSPALADELHHLINWPAGPHGLDVLRVESVSLLAWTSELVLAMLGQLEAAQLRQQTAARQRTLLPSRPVAAGSAAAGGTVSLWGARSLPCL
jgi:hypothetical protein